MLEDAKNKERIIFPSIPPTLLREVCEHLINETGVEAIAEIKYVEEKDLPLLKMPSGS